MPQLCKACSDSGFSSWPQLLACGKGRELLLAEQRPTPDLQQQPFIRASMSYRSSNKDAQGQVTIRRSKSGDSLRFDTAEHRHPTSRLLLGSPRGQVEVARRSALRLFRLSLERNSAFPRMFWLGPRRPRRPRSSLPRGFPGFPGFPPAVSRQISEPGVPDPSLP